MPQDKKENFLWEIFEALVIAIVLAAVIRFFIFQPFYIPSSSMEPTLVPGDRIIVNKFLYRFTEPARGDVVVFKYPKDPKRDFIKRIVGLPGDTLEIRNSMLYVNGELVEEPYLSPGITFPDFGPVQIPADAYYTFGDNRNNSEDSRFWGEVPAENMLGKAVVIYWPLSRLGIIQDLADYQK